MNLRHEARPRSQAVRRYSGTEPSIRSVPRTMDALTPQWVTSALATHHPGVEVSSVEVVDVDPGTTTRVRLRLHYRAGEGPETVFMKTQGGLSHRLMLQTMGILFPEERLFRTQEMLPIETPRVYATAVDRARLWPIVLMEDLTLRGAIAQHFSGPLDPEVVGRGLDQLASLHARFWGVGPGQDALGWVPRWRTMPGWGLVVGSNSQAGIRRLSKLGRHDLLLAEANNWRRMTTWWARSQNSVFRGLPTLLHGDTHPGNTYRIPDGPTGFLDWQCVRRGSWEHDVGYFLVGALDVDDRRAHERELLDRYLTGLREHGVEPPTSAQAWSRYRQTPAYGFPIWVAVFGLGPDYQADENTIPAVERYAAAFQDLRTAEAF